MTTAAHVHHRDGGERAPRSANEAVALPAGRQHRVVARRQLLAAGLGRGVTDRRIESGLLQPLHRGVYAVGHRALRAEAWWIAAVLAAGPGAVLSYRSAAELWGLRSGSRRRIEVTVARRRRSTARLRVHEGELQPGEGTGENGGPGPDPPPPPPRPPRVPPP